MSDLLKAAKKPQANTDIRIQLRKQDQCFQNARTECPESCPLSSWPHNARMKDLADFFSNKTPDDRIRIVKSCGLLHLLESESDYVYMTSLPERYAVQPHSLI